MHKEVVDMVEDEAEAVDKDEAEDKDKDADEETRAADGVATATGRRSNRMRGHATTALKRDTSGRTALFGNELMMLVTNKQGNGGMSEMQQ